MFVTREEAERRLKSQRNLVNSLGIAVQSPSVEHQSVPRPHRGPEVPEFLRVTAGVLAHSATINHVAESLGVDSQVVQQAKNGKIGGRSNVELQNKVEGQLGHVREVALEKLMSSLGLIDADKLKAASAVQLARISADMSRVVEKLANKDADKGNTQIIVYAPQVREENRYKTVDV